MFSLLLKIPFQNMVHVCVLILYGNHTLVRVVFHSVASTCMYNIICISPCSSGGEEGKATLEVNQGNIDP